MATHFGDFVKTHSGTDDLVLYFIHDLYLGTHVSRC